MNREGIMKEAANKQGGSALTVDGREGSAAAGKEEF